MIGFLSKRQSQSRWILSCDTGLQMASVYGQKVESAEKQKFIGRLIVRRLLKAIVPDEIVQVRRMLLEAVRWRRRSFAPPSPHYIKRRLLGRYSKPDVTWIETGTYLGDTSAFLARISSRVFTIEPDGELFRRAVKRFAANKKISVIGEPSEEALPQLLPQIQGQVCFWLDGHYSGLRTFEGSVHTPIKAELAAIELHIDRFKEVTILIDDVRLFADQSEDYPPLDYIVDWARRLGLAWSIEHDIFVAKK